MAAWQAAMSGGRVIIADEQNELGGWLLGESDTMIDDKPADRWIEDMVARLSEMENVTLLPRTTVFGYGDHNFITLCERVTDHLPSRPAHLPRQRLWKVRATEVIIATGAHERPLVFSGNDLPGVMLAGAARQFANRGAGRDVWLSQPIMMMPIAQLLRYKNWVSWCAQLQILT